MNYKYELFFTISLFILDLTINWVLTTKLPRESGINMKMHAIL